MTTEVHPAFFMDTMTWECRKKRVGKKSYVIKAKSLSHLQEKLGDGHTIIGYYPKGYNEVINYPKGPVIQKYSMAEISEKYAKHKKLFPKTKVKKEVKQRVYVATQRIKVTPDILENMQKLLKQGYSRSAIAERYGISRNAVIGTLYRAKRRKSENEPQQDVGPLSRSQYPMVEEPRDGRADRTEQG